MPAQREHGRFACGLTVEVQGGLCIMVGNNRAAGRQYAVHDAITSSTAGSEPPDGHHHPFISTPPSGKSGGFKPGVRQTIAGMGEIEHALTISDLRQHAPDVLDRQHVLAAAQHPSIPALRRHVHRLMPLQAICAQDLAFLLTQRMALQGA